MKKTNLILIMSLAAVLGTGQSTYATGQTSDNTQANQAISQAETERTEAERTEAIQAKAEAEVRVQAEYQKTMAEASRSHSNAEAAIAQARAELVKVNKEQLEAQRELSDERRAEVEAMREKLTRTHRELRESSRALSQINRELMFLSQPGIERRIIISGGDKPVIGVILGGKTGVGVEVLGVSPNGPAERAGLQAGDVIVAVGGRALSSVDGSGDTRSGLNIALNELKASEPVIVSVERGVDTLDLKVVPEIREPLTWQSVTRLRSLPAAPAAPSSPSAISTPAVVGAPSTVAAPSAPSAPAAPGGLDDSVWFEQIEVQEIDREALAAQIARMEVEIAQRGGLPMPAPGHNSHWISGDTEGYEFYFGDMSELGDLALSDTSAWYGMPLTSGLRLAEIDPALGEYFNTDRGVLVLKAKQDNALLLQAGDVVLSLHGTEVNSPAEFMRALREFAPGEALQIDIKRKRKNQTLSPLISDEQARFLTPQPFQNFQVIVSDNGH